MSEVETQPVETPAPPTALSSRVAWKLFWLRRAIAAIILALGISVIWHAVVKNRMQVVNFGVVEVGSIYRSNQLPTRIWKDALQSNHIEVIVNLVPPSNAPDGAVDAEVKAAQELGISRLTFPLRGDGRGDPAMYVKAVQAIVDAKKSGKAVLVHCTAGEQRTSGVIAAYRVIIQGRSEEDAFKEARKYLYDPKHNPYLRPYFDEHLPEWRTALAPNVSVSTR